MKIKWVNGYKIFNTEEALKKWLLILSDHFSKKCIKQSCMNTLKSDELKIFLSTYYMGPFPTWLSAESSMFHSKALYSPQASARAHPYSLPDSVSTLTFLSLLLYYCLASTAGLSFYDTYVSQRTHMPVWVTNGHRQLCGEDLGWDRGWEEK